MIDVEEHEDEHAVAATRTAHRIATGYAAATLAERARLDAAEAAAEARFEWITSRCRGCGTTRHPSSVCPRHRAEFDIPE